MSSPYVINHQLGTNQYVWEKTCERKLWFISEKEIQTLKQLKDSNIVINNNNNTINPGPTISGICITPNNSHFVGSTIHNNGTCLLNSASSHTLACQFTNVSECGKSAYAHTSYLIPHAPSLMPMTENYFHSPRMAAQQWNLVYFWIDFGCLSLIDDDIVESSSLRFHLQLFLLCFTSSQ